MPFITRLLLPRLLTTVAVAFVAVFAAHADTYPRQPGVDALHYRFRLTLADASNEIAGDADVRLRFTAANVRQVALDLATPARGAGMTVLGVTAQGKTVAYTHRGDRLVVTLPAAPEPGEELAIGVRYRGAPAAGLRLLDNIHGERTMFSENWPNHARQWLPMIDHPYDKATGEFIVTAPAHYQVVANGLLVGEHDLPGNLRRTHWRQSVPIASWLFALGVARFSTHHYAVVRGVPQQVWSFPQDREAATTLFETTGQRAFEYFSDTIGPYPYEKLAHVQAAGLSGGTEHASAIFYGEKGVAGGRAPVVHEVAHQWWGNAVTERDWDDVWLSEGFATYFTHLFTEHADGQDEFVRELKADIPVIVQAQLAAPSQAVIHRNLADMRTVLNRLVYQKAGWVLHMLRGVVGTDRFWAGIRAYYQRYRNTNASTDDFRQVMEHASGMELSWFFDQWLRRPGTVKLKGAWRYDSAAKQVRVTLLQTQPGAPYRLPLDIGLVDGTGQTRVERIEMKDASGKFDLAAEREPVSVVLDPGTWVLMEPPDFGRERPALVAPKADKGRLQTAR